MLLEMSRSCQFALCDEPKPKSLFANAAHYFEQDEGSWHGCLHHTSLLHTLPERCIQHHILSLSISLY